MFEQEVYEQLSRQEKVFLSIIGTCDVLKRKGMLEGGEFELSENGRDLLDKLEEEGFKPTIEEMQEAFKFLNENNFDEEV